MEKFLELLQNLKIRNYIHAIFYPSVILLFGSLFYRKTYAFSNEQIAKFSILWIAVSLAEFFFNDMLSLFQIYSLRAQQEEKKIFVDKLWWAFVVIIIHTLILGVGLYISFRIFKISMA